MTKDLCTKKIFRNAENFGKIIGDLRGYRNQTCHTVMEQLIIQDIIDDLDKLFTTVNAEIIYGEEWAEDGKLDVSYTKGGNISQAHR